MDSLCFPLFQYQATEPTGGTEWHEARCWEREGQGGAVPTAGMPVLREEEREGKTRHSTEVTESTAAWYGGTRGGRWGPSIPPSLPTSILPCLLFPSLSPSHFSAEKEQLEQVTKEMDERGKLFPTPFNIHMYHKLTSYALKNKLKLTIHIVLVKICWHISQFNISQYYILCYITILLSIIFLIFCFLPHIRKKPETETERTEWQIGKI